MDYLSIFPERLSELMFYKELTATQLSEILECESSTISHYLSGLHLPTVEMAVTLADYFNVTTDFLFGLESENKAANFKKCPPFGERFKEVCKANKISRYKITQKNRHCRIRYALLDTRQNTAFDIKHYQACKVFQLLD